jgi:hypothetical protein
MKILLMIGEFIKHMKKKRKIYNKKRGKVYGTNRKIFLKEN